MKKDVPQEIEEFSKRISGGYWNTRIIKHEEKNETYYAIHEVYYDKNDDILGWSEDPISLIFEDKLEFKEILKQILEATKQPILLLKKDSKKLTETKEMWDK